MSWQKTGQLGPMLMAGDRQSLGITPDRWVDVSVAA
jgi:hypothetical protein